jgi:4-hydroxy-tetrahydrodipicolinate synthase
MATKQSRYTGTGVNLIVPMTSDNEIDFPGLKALVNRVKKQGADFLVMLDTACEGSRLTDIEKLKVIEAVTDYNNNDLPLLIALEGAHDNIAPFIDLLSYNESCNVAKLCLLPNAIEDEVDVLDFYTRIAQRSNCNIIIDQHQDAKPVDSTIVKKLVDQYPNIAGIVVRDRSIDRIIDLRNNLPSGFAIIGDYERFALSGLAVGMSAIISVVANAYTREISNFFNLAMVGKQERSRKVFYELLPTIDRMYSEGVIVAAKSALALDGICSNYQRLNVNERSKSMFGEYQNTWPDDLRFVTQHSPAKSA